MPSTRLERFIAAGGLVAACALAIFTVVAWVGYANGQPGQDSPPVVLERPTRQVPPHTTTAGDRIDPAQRRSSVATARPSPRNTQMHLTLRAVRGDCWVAVRLRDAAGKLVYAGILAQGQSRSFTAKRLWIELGASHTLDATLDGEPVTNLPTGTATVIATRDGVEPATAT